MDFPYPSAPASVPAEFTRPTRAYQRHVTAAVAALAAFALLYLGMAWWFAHTAWVLIQTARGGEAFWAWFAAIPALFLFAFLVKGLFFLKREGPDTSDEVKREDEPKLFAFIDRLADDVGAPRPHRVFLTNRVNAAVFYDVSFWNLIFPSRKNLEIGLGLVNVLTLDEFKAVLAHELGHFAQRSMTVGTWVYTGGRAISAVVSRRDAFDGFLNGLSRFDLRIAWVGWLLRIVVWSLRAVLDTAFRLLILAERALSREMEFQADLVAASVTGSDSLLHALRRLGPADDALGRAMGFSVGQAQGGEGRVADLFEVQTGMLGHLRRVMGDPHLGSVPPLSGGGRKQQRLFSPDIAESPRMWSSHPPNHEREANTKRLYVASILDSRSAWCLFADEKRLRRDATERFYKEAHLKALESPAVDGPTSVVELDRLWERRRFDAAYRGAYVGRSAVLDETDATALMGKEPLDLRDARDRLYPPSLVTTLEAWKASEAQAAQLKALRDGVLTAPGGVIRFQGRDIARSQLAATIQTVEGERLTLRKRLADHDRDVRRTHLGMAAALGQGWDAHLRGTLRAIHFLEHAGADLDDAEGALNATFHVVIADGNVSNREMKLLLAACTAVHQSLVGIYGSAKVLSLPADALAALKVTSWEAELAEELKLGAPTREGLAENWLQVASTWIRAGGGGLERAASAALDSLLAAEAHVARCWTEALDPGVAPPPCTVPANYPTVREGVRRKRPALGWWDRFQTADGVVPGVLRLGASAAVLTPGLLLTWQLGESDVAVYNGPPHPGDRAAWRQDGTLVGRRTPDGLGGERRRAGGQGHLGGRRGDRGLQRRCGLTGCHLRLQHRPGGQLRQDVVRVRRDEGARTDPARRRPMVETRSRPHQRDAADLDQIRRPHESDGPREPCRVSTGDDGRLLRGPTRGHRYGRHRPRAVGPAERAGLADVVGPREGRRSRCAGDRGGAHRRRRAQRRTGQVTPRRRRPRGLRSGHRSGGGQPHRS